MTGQAPASLTAADVVAAVRRHYGAERDGLGPEWAALDEFSLGPGTGRGRADLLLVRAWRSGPKMHERHAVEVKVSRSDLASELANPHKAWPFEQVTHRFYLATPAGLVRDTDPVPDHWGLLEVKGGRVRRVREAPRREPDPMPEGAVVEAFRRAARAEARIRGADADGDPAARVVDLEKRLAAAERARHTAKAASRRDKDRLRNLLAEIAAAGGWQCVCGAPMKREQYRSEHADGSRCAQNQHGFARTDLEGLAVRLGIVADRTEADEAFSTTVW